METEKHDTVNIVFPRLDFRAKGNEREREREIRAERNFRANNSEDGTEEEGWDVEGWAGVK